MKIAIASTGNNLDASIDRYFSRCSYFAVYNTIDKTIQFIQNSGKKNIEAAGPATVELLNRQKICKVISGGFGSKVKPILDQLQIQLILINEPDKKVGEIIQLIHQNTNIYE